MAESNVVLEKNCLFEVDKENEILNREVGGEQLNTNGEQLNTNSKLEETGQY